MTNKSSKINVAIVGGTGYAGQTLVDLLIGHPKAVLKKIVSKSHINESYADVCPKYLGLIELKLISIDMLLDELEDIDLVFISVPHGQSKMIVEALSKSHVKIIDLGGDFRLSDVHKSFELYKNDNEDLIKAFEYGLCELNKELIKTSDYVASPGCYATAIQLALLPLIDKSYVKSIIVDGKSGISGAGKALKSDNMYSEAVQNLKAYAVEGHRHKDEVVMTVKKDILFIPHLIPMYKGIMCSLYIELDQSLEQEVFQVMYERYYKDSHFVRVKKTLSEVKHVIGSNFCDLSIRLDDKTNTLMVFSCIDNLMKGASGQGIQNMNLMFGFDETSGL